MSITFQVFKQKMTMVKHANVNHISDFYSTRSDISSQGWTEMNTDKTVSEKVEELIAMTQGPVGRIFTCTLCMYSHSRKFVIREHIRTHTGEKPHKCLTCGKGFAKKCNLNSHLKSACHSKM